MAAKIDDDDEHEVEPIEDFSESFFDQPAPVEVKEYTYSVIEDFYRDKSNTSSIVQKTTKASHISEKKGPSLKLTAQFHPDFRSL